MTLRDLQAEWDEARETNPLMQDEAFPGVIAWIGGACLTLVFLAIFWGVCALYFA